MILGVFASIMGYSQERDNTGTNPANFTYDVRFYSEMASFSDPEGSYRTIFLEFLFPLSLALFIIPSR